MKIGIFTRVKNEQKIIKEWIIHYINLGFDKVFIYDNISSPSVHNTINGLLKEYLDKVVIFHDISINKNQEDLYTECLSIARQNNLDWIFCCDADELLSLRIDKSLKSFLEDFSKDTAVIPVNSVTFGQGGNKTFDHNKLVIEQFNIRENYEYFYNLFVKSFLRPNLIEKCDNSHKSSSCKYYTKNVYNEIISNDANVTTGENERAKINDETPLVLHHYMTLDQTSMLEKRERNIKEWPTSGDKYTLEWYSREFKDKIKDKSMFKYIEDIKKNF